MLENKTIKFRKITRHNFEQIPKPCKSCLYWQTDETSTQSSSEAEAVKKKLEWLERTSKEFGNCIMIACLQEKPIGFIQYASGRFFPKISEYASGPSSEDAVFISCLYVVEESARRKGYGSTILKELIRRLDKKKYKSVETFARKSCTNNPSGALGLYLKHGFRIINEKDDFPLVRLDLF